MARDHRQPRCRRRDPPRPRRCSAGLRGTFAIAASRAPGVTVTIRAPVRRRSTTPSCGPISRPTAAWTPRPTIRGRAPAGEADRRRRRGDRRPGARASAGRSGSRSPGTCPWSSSGPGAAGGSATRATGAGPASAPSTSPRMPSSEAPRLARRDRGLAGAGPRRSPTGPTGTRRRSSTSSTSWSTAAPSGRPARSAAPSPTPTTPAGSRSSSASTTRSTTRVDVDFYASFAILRLFPELEARGIRDLLAAIAGRRPGDRRRSRRPGEPAPRKVGGTVPHDVGGRTTTRSTARTGTSFQDVNDWKDLGPKFVLQVWRDAVAAASRRRRPDPRRAGRPSRPC